MDTVAGIFPSHSDARRVAARLRARGAKEDQISMLVPGEGQAKLDEVPADEMEQPGVGKALGGVVGAALGIAGGAHLGTAAATALIPGVGPVMAIGMTAAALLGVGGAIGGSAAGKAIETSLAGGLPKDELWIYEDALRQGRTVLIASAASEEEADNWRKIMEDEGAESVDAARERIWLGLRDAEREHYDAGGRDFARDEESYRRGFEAALHKDFRGKTARECLDALRQKYGACCEDDSFLRGYNRGQERHQHLQEQS